MCGLFHELSSDAAAPEVRLDKWSFEIRNTIITWNDDDKARRRAPMLEHNDQTRPYVLVGKLESTGVLHLFRKRRIPLQRCTTLQLLERLALRRLGGAELARDGISLRFHRDGRRN